MAADPHTAPLQKRQGFEKRLKTWLGADLSTAQGRRRAWWSVQLIDHAFLRTFWHNFHEVVPGVFRSNQPNARRLARYKALGIRSLITLRGASDSAVMAFQQEACAELGLKVHLVGMSARALAPAERYLHLLNLFETVERPFLIHCKSGADRTGLGAAFYLIDQEGQSVAEASRHLGPRYMHFRRSKTGILDALLDSYAETGEAEGISLRDWLATRYDPAAVTAAFRGR